MPDPQPSKVAPHAWWWRKIGPGIITGAADDDPSGIGTYSIAGAQFGYRLLWLTPLCLPLMIVVQEMCGRIAEITGEGLAAVIMTIVGYLGTTISPYLFFWQAGETVEEEIAEGVEEEPGQRIRDVTESEIRQMRADTIMGMIFSQAITFFIIICTSSTLHPW